MTFWIVAAIVSMAAAAWLARPFLRFADVEPNESEHAISIFRDQLDELKRDRMSGLISGAEYDAAEQEIEGRALRAARRLDAGITVVRRSPAIAFIAVAATLFGGFGLYGALGTPSAEDRPFAERRLEILERRAAAGDPASRIALLQARAEENPESLDAWWVLAKSYAAVGDHASAADAYRHAVSLSDDDPAVLSAYAEAMTLANGNKVPRAAALIFQQVMMRTADPRARYYVALAQAQQQNFDGALSAWLALLNDSDPTAPWVALVRRDIVNMARFLERDLAELLPDATPEEQARAAGLAAETTNPPAADDPMARIAELESHLAQTPKDYQTSIELAALKAQQGDAAAARAVLAQARVLYAAAPFVLSALDQAEATLHENAGSRGPTAEQVAEAAATMSPDQQKDMIDGMVAGLATRLDDNPQDVDGWVMLIRSYAVLQRTDDAATSIGRALATFEANAPAREQILQVAEEFGLETDTP